MSVRASRRIALVDDLRRTWFGYRLAQLGCLLTSYAIPYRSMSMGLTAFAPAFTESEVEQLSQDAGLPRPSIRVIGHNVFWPVGNGTGPNESAHRPKNLGRNCHWRWTAGHHVGHSIVRTRHAVLLVEAKRFPRDKVCGGCLNRRA